MKQPSSNRDATIFPNNLRVLFLLLVTCLVAGAWAQSANAEFQPKVHFVTLFGALGERDLRWIGQKSTIDDQLSEVILENAGDQDILGFQIGWALYIPEGCGVREEGVPRSEVHMAPFEPHTLRPGGRVTVGPYHLSSEAITNFARHAHSPAVVAQASIVRIRFSNGNESVSDVERKRRFVDEPASYPCEELQKPAEAEDALKTYFSSREFQFQYASLLIPCEQRTQGNGEGFYWVQESCNAYFPVCDDGGSQDSDTIACIAYPNKKFEDAPTFEAAAFSVAVVYGASSEKDCLAGSPGWLPITRKSGDTRTIDQIKFTVFEMGEAGMSQGVSATVYRTFHGNKCYQLSIRMASANPGAFDPGINEFTPEDANEVNSRLEQVLDSFHFLK